ALALGIAKKEEIFLAKAKGIGNPVIYVGAKTGRDGIHGASLLASAEFTEESKQKRPNVQVGDPFMEKLLLEACLEAMQTDAVVVGQVTEGGIARINNNGRVAAEIPAHPLAEEGPVYHRPIAAPSPRIQTEKDWFAFAPEGANLTANLGKLLASPAIASKRWITEQYDTSVRTNHLAGPGASA